MVDDERRENEGDLICAAQYASPDQINFMATHARGLICLAMEGQQLDALDLPLMVDRNTDANQTAFTVSIDAGPENGVSTGISAEDRSKTIQVALRQDARPTDLRRPGHIFPLRARQGGVLKRAGHTEAAIDLSALSGLIPAGVICEIQNADGSMARLPQLKEYADQWNLRLISIADLIRYRLENERFVVRQAYASMPSVFGEFKAIGYRNELDGSEHVAIVKGDPDRLSEPVLVRMHSECLTGDAFGSLRCDCRPQLEAALRQIEAEGEGVVVYLRQEGRGIGLINKLKAYSLQDGGLDTVEANEKLGFPADLRNYGVGAQILSDLGIHRLRLLTNNPRKIAGLGGYGLEVVDRVPLVINPGDHNADYLAVKRDKLGHLFQASIDQPNAPILNGEDSIIAPITSQTVISWDGNCRSDQLPLIRTRCETAASNLEVSITANSSPRLLALWERPQFAWRITDVQRGPGSTSFTTRLRSLIQTLASWQETSRIGLYTAPTAEQLNHPSQTLERIEASLEDVRSGRMPEQSQLEQPTLLMWS